MALDLKRMEDNILYKTLDENEMYFTTGLTYIVKYGDSRKHLFPKKPIIYIYHFNSDGKIDSVSYGTLINKKYQSGTAYSIMGWTIDKDSNMNEIGLKETAHEIVCSWAKIEPTAPLENSLLNIEISNFFNDPIEYLNNQNIKQK